ncbi:MAG: hypothetical protein ACSHW1_10605 [Yoonia sp.]|uniref:hypothetical protein n=1 Tax=Yoonia sp. TaxID=2212373 RepID=UPI003EF1D1F4
MTDVYEYRQAPNKGPIRLAALCLVGLILTIFVNGTGPLFWVAWSVGAVTIAWMMFPRPIYGIKVDDTYLVLAAWRNPRYVPLDEIAHLRVSNVSEETKVSIVYKDGVEEAIFAADLPDLDVLVGVMAERRVPVRDIYL